MDHAQFCHDRHVVCVHGLVLGRESGDDVRADGGLDLDGALGGEQVEALVDVAAEAGAALVDGAIARQREDLVPAGVGEHRAVPAHEPMDPPDPAEELDAWAEHQVVGVAEHLWATAAGDDDPIAYCRIFPAGVKYPEASIGRVASAARVRRTGAGRALMTEALRRMDAARGGATAVVRISAQSYLQRFYEGLGFHVVSEPYLEDDIPHLEMLRGG